MSNTIRNIEGHIYLNINSLEDFKKAKNYIIPKHYIYDYPNFLKVELDNDNPYPYLIFENDEIPNFYPIDMYKNIILVIEFLKEKEINIKAVEDYDEIFFTFEDDNNIKYRIKYYSNNQQIKLEKLNLDEKQIRENLTYLYDNVNIMKKSDIKNYVKDMIKEIWQEVPVS